MDGGQLKCPECRVIHVAPNKEKTFPQNQYLLGIIRLREAESSESEEEPEEEVNYFLPTDTHQKTAAVRR